MGLYIGLITLGSHSCTSTEKIHNEPTVKGKSFVGEVTSIRLTKKGITTRCNNYGETRHKGKCFAPLKVDQPPKAPIQPKRNAPKQKKQNASSVATSTQQSHHTIPIHNMGVGVLSAN